VLNSAFIGNIRLVESYGTVVWPCWRQT